MSELEEQSMLSVKRLQCENIMKGNVICILIYDSRSNIFKNVEAKVKTEALATASRPTSTIMRSKF